MSVSWGYGGGIALASPSVDALDTRRKKKAAANTLAPTCWGRKPKPLKADGQEDDSTEPFRCNEPGHKGPRVRWLSLGSRFDKGHREGETECCGQLMELLPSDVATRTRKPKPKHKPEAEESTE